MRAIFHSRLYVILFILVLLSFGLIAKLFFIQIIEGHQYQVNAKAQYTANGDFLTRGNIYFTRKDGVHIAAATSKTGYLIAINPKTLQNPQKVYTTLNAIVPVNKTTFFAAVAKKNDQYEKIVTHISLAQGGEVIAKGLRGVIIARERWSYYPGGTLAAHSIGFVAYNHSNTVSGQYGLERYYNNTLAQSSINYKNFFLRIFSGAGSFFVDPSATKKGDIVTSIEPVVETHLLAELTALRTRYNAKSAGAIVMVPSTGAIVALGSVPTYDPNTFQTASTSLFINPLVQNVYEYGSIMKPITMASALDAGVVTPKTTYDDIGCIQVNSDKICNWDSKARGVIPVGQIIVQSLNVGASWLAGQLGQQRFKNYFTKLFGQKTGIDLPGEVSGLIGNLQSTRQVDFDTMSFGQGIAITPVQMIRALGTIANAGVMVQPHIATGKILTSGKTVPIVWNKKKRIFSAIAASETASMMVDLTNTELYHGQYIIPGIPVAVKTGTAQLVKPSGGYYTNRFFHSYVGFFPAHAPRFIILFYLNYPHDTKDTFVDEYSSETLTKPMFDMVHFLIDYYNIQPNSSTINAYTS